MSKIPKPQNSSSRPFIVPTTQQKHLATTRLTKRTTKASSSEIFYSLTPKEENLIFNNGAMKRVTSHMKMQLKKDKSVYLETRYKAAPSSKFNFPEATSWRYGWFY